MNGICSCSLFVLRLFAVQGTTMTAFNREKSVVPVRSAINRDSRYVQWPTPTAILYRLDPAYNSTEIQFIQQAMNQISSDMNQCIRFQLYTSANGGTDHLYIGKTLGTGSAPPTCFSFPGRVASQRGQGQKLALFGTVATSGCLDSQRDIMKYLVHALGLRNEYNRPDRDQYITVFTPNIKSELQSLNLFRTYTPAQVDYLNTAFDYQSVTIPSPTKYANPGTVVYAVSRSGQSFGTLARLSQGDCVGIALQYTGCNFASCANPYGTTPAVIAGTQVVGLPVVSPIALLPGINPVVVVGAMTTTAAPTTAVSTLIPPLEPGNPLSGFPNLF